MGHIENQLDARNLTYLPIDRVFMADASDLRWPPGEWPSTIGIKGKGRTAAFHFRKRERDPDGDILAWLYTSEVEGVWYTLRVFND